jgi:uncharacterized protein (UPF0264 family)
VRNACEAQAVVAHAERVLGPAGAGAWALDLKDPAAGSLGRPAAGEIEATLEAIDNRCALSVAWGELSEWKAPPPKRWQGQIRLIKLGLARMATQPNWVARWERAARDIAPIAGPVAVIYADGPCCAAPHPGEIVDHACRLDCPVVLIDTCDKSLGPIWNHWTTTQARRWIERIQSCGLRAALAGSLGWGSLAAAQQCGPDFVAVRSILCHAGRQGPLCEHRVERVLQRWRSLLSAGAAR